MSESGSVVRLDVGRRRGRDRDFASHEAERLRRMALIGEFASGAAHDLGNLFAVIMMTLGRLQGARRTGEFERQAECALEAAATGMAVTRALLRVASNQIEHSEVFDPNVCIGRFASLLREAAGFRVRLHLALEPGVWPIIADPHATVLALLNLTMNARDAMPSGGDLHIASANVGLCREVGGLTGDFVALSAVDNGAGMTKRVMAQACRPFFTTKGPGRGTGLGLAKVREFAQRSGGAIAIESEEGSGTKVTLYLPRAVGH